MGKPIVIGFYGYSDSGKTTLIERLIQELTLRGKKIAAIKQSSHPVSMDSQGKDTCRFTQAGADPVVLSSSIETNIKFNKALGIDEIIKFITTIQQVDIIIIESARDAEIMKIRIGDIELRENTFWTYNGNFEELVNKIVNGGE
ncbi:MAG: molybdopterin-guanine dinucleotide biosynthesis protein B [Pelolinea sp.]|nr:molybdopterin-guanine dinucleotide biosynthesis protein B [Pelolinea sp.]